MIDKSKLEVVCRELLSLIGEDVNRPGLQDTPRRFANWWSEFIEYDSGCISTSFGMMTTDQMVVVSGMKVWSICEHHLLPFLCDISIGYITDSKLLGLSKFARVAHKHSHRLQVQERLVHNIADEIQTLTSSNNVAILGKGEHLCMQMRGIRTSGLMITSVMRGVFRDKPELGS